MDVETLENHFQKVKQIEKKVNLRILVCRINLIAVVIGFSVALTEMKYARDWQSGIGTH